MEKDADAKTGAGPDGNDAGSRRPGSTPRGIPDGWTVRRSTAFDTHIGPFYYPPFGGFEQCGFLADQRHGNSRGVVHGGMIAPAFDVGLGNVTWEAIGRRAAATIQLNVHYIGAMNVGEFAIVRSEVVRQTRSLAFARGVMQVGDRVIASADGIWKILEQRAT